MTKTFHDSEILQENQQVITACAFIHRIEDGEYKLFLPKRAKTKKFLPGVYEFPGGHIEFGEDIVNGLKREVKEEFNMEISVGDPFYVFTYLNKIKKSHSIEVIFYARFISELENITINKEDHESYEWVTKDRAVELIIENKGEDDKEYGAIIKGFDILEAGISVINFA